MSTPQYLPPDAVGGAAPASNSDAVGYVPPNSRPDAAAPVAPTAGYRPPSVGAPPAATYQQPPTPTRPPVVTEPPAPAEPAASEVVPNGPRIAPLLLIGGAIVALLVVGLVVAWLLGAFAPKLSHLPARVGDYALDVSTQKSSASLFDSATYRAAAGDIYQAGIVKNAPDPAVAFNRASADTRFQVGNVYCVGVSKTGKGGTCGVLLSTGSAATVEGSTKHAASDLAQFTQDLAAAIT